jgi:hypothetical protein
MPGKHRKLTQAEMLAELRERFGENPLDWAFKCPSCGDVATAQDFGEALAAHPRVERGEPLTASGIIGQECIGRTLGVLAKTGGKYTGRGCDWCAYGLFRGPWEIVMPDGRSAWSFPIAPAPARAAKAESR